MSKLKKFAGILLALVMCFGLTCTAFADDGYTITISNSTNGYTYVAYQIFAGDLSEDGVTLSNITWGSGIDSSNESLQAALTEKYGTTDAATIAEKISTTADAAAFAEIIADYVTNGTTATYSEANSNYTISVSAAGYYLVKNTDVPTGDYAYSDYIMEVVTDVTVTPKSTGTPTFDKEVDSTTDANDETTADYDVGDDVEFTLTATLPTSISAYSEYTLIFHDTLSSGLDFNDDVTITVGDVTLSEDDYSVDYDTDTTTGETTITITISDLLDLTTEDVTVASGTEVVVTYTAELTVDATTDYQNNSAYLEYSNNPNGDETGKTGTDETYVINLTLSVNKTDGEKALPGAGFTLYKYDETTESYVAVGNEITDVTTFNFTGLAVGSYKLVETTTPDGYNTADDIYFTIEATTSENESTGEVTVSVTIKDASGAVISTGDDATFSVNSTTIGTEVVNKAGSSLPTTGGMGTTIFYVVGGVLVVGAVVLLITKKRMSE